MFAVNLSRCRFDRVDCERYSNDESIVNANRNSIPDESSSAVEYKVHGLFSSREGARCFPDTFMFSARDLKDAGMPKKRIRQAVIDYHAQLLVQGMGDLEEVSSDEEEGPSPAMQQAGAAMDPGGGAAVEGTAAVETAVVNSA